MLTVVTVNKKMKVTRIRRSDGDRKMMVSMKKMKVIAAMVMIIIR